MPIASNSLGTCDVVFVSNTCLQQPVTVHERGVMVNARTKAVDSPNRKHFDSARRWGSSAYSTDTRPAQPAGCEPALAAQHQPQHRGAAPAPAVRLRLAVGRVPPPPPQPQPRRAAAWPCVTLNAKAVPYTKESL
jgi:hypothetical protein